MKVVGLYPLCIPSLVYLIISFIFISLIYYQNRYFPNVYCVGNGCQTENLISIYTLKILFVIFWAWILNILCAAGFSVVSWLVIWIPFIVYIIWLVFYMYVPVI